MGFYYRANLRFSPVYWDNWASLVAQTVKHLPAMQETWVWSLGQEHPLEKGMTPTSVFLPGKSHGQRSLAGYSLWGHKESHDWVTNTHTCINWADSLQMMETKLFSLTEVFLSHETGRIKPLSYGLKTELFSFLPWELEFLILPCTVSVLTLWLLTISMRKEWYYSNYRHSL